MFKRDRSCLLFVIPPLSYESRDLRTVQYSARVQYNFIGTLNLLSMLSSLSVIKILLTIHTPCDKSFGLNA